MDIQTLKKVPIVDVLAQLGHYPTAYKKANTDLWYLSPVRTEKTASFHVNVPKNVWYDHGLGVGGDIIDLLLRLLPDLDGISGVLSWCDDFTGVSSFSMAVAQEVNVMLDDIEIVRELSVINHPALLQYLSSRHIKPSKLEACAVELHYKRGDRVYFSLAHKNELGGYECRSKDFKACIGRKCVNWVVKSEDAVLSVFESWSDYYAFMHWYHDRLIKGTILVLNSVSLLNSVLHLFQQYDTIYTFFDNDRAGSAATEKAAQYGNIVDCRYRWEGYKDIAEWYEGYFKEAY